MERNNRLDAHGQPLNRAFNAKRLQDRGVDELLGLCRGIIADDVVNDAEARFLLNWLESNQALAQHWPGNIIYARIYEFLRDGHIDEEEHAELLDLLKQCTGHVPEACTVQAATSLPFDSPQPPITFTGRLFVLTGKFAYGTRKDCTQAIVELGGNVLSNIRKDTHYMVIGTLASRDWIHASYGRKIEAAIQWKEQGAPIRIISEDHWAGCIVG